MLIIIVTLVLGDTPYGNLQLEDGIAKDGLTDAYDRIPMVTIQFHNSYKFLVQTAARITCCIFNPFSRVFVLKKQRKKKALAELIKMFMLDNHMNALPKLGKMVRSMLK